MIEYEIVYRAIDYAGNLIRFHYILSNGNPSDLTYTVENADKDRTKLSFGSDIIWEASLRRIK